MINHTIIACLLFSNKLFLPSEASLLPLPVILAHFTLSANEQARFLHISFPTSELAKLKVKSRLIKSFWNKFFVHHLFILSSSSL